MKNWYLWDDGINSPAFNMAADELLLQKAKEIQRPILRIYYWDRPAVTIGYIQKYTAAPQSGYTIIRRPTGGGIVFHDVDLTYTVVIPSGHEIEKLNRIESYHVFHKAVINALSELNVQTQLVDFGVDPKDRQTMQCFTAPTKYDVVAKLSDSTSKIAGAAQRRSKTGILHQGSIVIDDMDINSDKLSTALIKAFKEHFNITFHDFLPNHEFLEEVEELAKTKYNTDEWNKQR